MLIAVILPASTRNVASMCWRRGARPDDQQVRLVGVAGVADLARDHPQALVAAQEPAADALDAAQHLDAVADVHAHLGLLVHQRDRALAVAAVQLLEEVFHRLDSTHGRSVPSGAHGRRPRLRRRSPPRGRSSGSGCEPSGCVLRLPTDDELLDAHGPRQGRHPSARRDALRGRRGRRSPSPAFERGTSQYHWGSRAGWSRR